MADRLILTDRVRFYGDDVAAVIAEDEVAASRTFVFVREIEPLLSAGLIKGGDLDNAIVIYERKMSQESFDKLADVMRVPHMDAEQLGYINHKTVGLGKRMCPATNCWM